VFVRTVAPGARRGEVRGRQAFRVPRHRPG
jgi:hypothetical protein